MNKIISDPELLFALSSKRGISKSDILESVRQLYSTHYPAVSEAERAIEKAHEGFSGIIGPVSSELFQRMRGDRSMPDDDFHSSVLLRSEWLVKEMRRIREVYERQYGSAQNLVNML